MWETIYSDTRDKENSSHIDTAILQSHRPLHWFELAGGYSHHKNTTEEESMVEY